MGGSTDFGNDTAERVKLLCTNGAVVEIDLSEFANRWYTRLMEPARKVLSLEIPAIIDAEDLLVYDVVIRSMVEIKERLRDSIQAINKLRVSERRHDLAILQKDLTALEKQLGLEPSVDYNHDTE